MAPSWAPRAIQKSTQVAHAGCGEPQPLGQERPRAAQERSQGHLGGILARSGTCLEGKIMVFPYVFQYFLNNDVFNKICALRPSSCSSWGILGGQERPKSAPRAAQEQPRAAQERPREGQERLKSGQDPAKSGQERAKSGQERPRAAQERPRAAQEQPRAAEERPKSGPGQPKSGQERPKSAQERPKSGKKCPKRAPTGNEKLKSNSEAIDVRIGTSRD